MKQTDQFDFGDFFADLFNHPDKVNDLLSGDSAFSIIEEELDELFIAQNLHYFVRLNEIKKDYKVLRNSSGKHKITMR